MEHSDDDEIMMDQVAMECMDALERKDKEAFLQSLHVLIADVIEDMQSGEVESEEGE